MGFSKPSDSTDDEDGESDEKPYERIEEEEHYALSEFEDG